VFGRQGRGTVEHFSCHGRVDIQVGTLSKAIGVLGGYVAGTKDFIEFLYHRARPFLFSTSHPPAVAAACIAAIDVLENVSRLNRDLLQPPQLEMTAAAREHLAIYRKNQDLINIGAYPAGSNPAIDHAIALHEPLTRFLRQPVNKGFTTSESWPLLQQTLSTPIAPPAKAAVNPKK